MRLDTDDPDFLVSFEIMLSLLPRHYFVAAAKARLPHESDAAFQALAQAIYAEITKAKLGKTHKPPNGKILGSS